MEPTQRLVELRGRDCPNHLVGTFKSSGPGFWNSPGLFRASVFLLLLKPVWIRLLSLVTKSNISRNSGGDS